MRRILLFFSCLAFWMAVPTLKAASNEYEVKVLSRRPVMDGKIDGDPGWNNIPWSNDFYETGTNLPAKKKSYFKIGYMMDSLFIAVKCEEPDMPAIKDGRKNMEDLWLDDSLEIFILPEDAGNYYQFILTPSGARWNGIGNGGKKNLEDWKVTIHKGNSFWSAEIEIPLVILRVLPSPGEIWRLNICRNIPDGRSRASSWAMTTGSFHNINNFGRVIFDK